MGKVMTKSRAVTRIKKKLELFLNELRDKPNRFFYIKF